LEHFLAHGRKEITGGGRTMYYADAFVRKGEKRREETDVTLNRRWILLTWIED